jgi:enoyl-CoA hydratase
MTKAEEKVIYRRNGTVGIITFNRPERLNAINGEFLRDFVKQLIVAREDKKVVAVVLTGAGKSFCAGEDLKETSAGKTFETWIDETNGLQDIQRLIMRLDKPLIGAVQGYAVGGGCEFAMSCDMRVAAENASFGFPETGVGLTVTTAGTKLLSQLVGLGKAKELIFTGEFIDAHEAFRIGLVNKVVPTERLMDESLKLANKISEKSPLALKLSRIAIDQGLHASFEEILEIEANHLLICAGAQSQKKYVLNKLKQMKKKK